VHNSKRNLLLLQLIKAIITTQAVTSVIPLLIVFLATTAVATLLGLIIPTTIIQVISIAF